MIHRLQSLQRLNLLQQALLGHGSLDEKLKRITEGVVEIFNADFCRIWLRRPADRCEKGCIHAKAKEEGKICSLREHCLHLVASSGRYTHIDGPHNRMPFGMYKLGRVAIGEVNKFLTNDVANDPQIMDHAWARGLGLVSFAGYRLQNTIVEPIGVLALFSKHPITPEEDVMLEGIAGITGHVIQTMEAQEALKMERGELVLFRALLDRSNDAIEVVDPETGRFLDMNEKALLDLNYSREELPFLRVWDIDPTVDQPSFTKIIEGLRKSGSIIFNSYHQRKDGSKFPVEINIKYVQLDRDYVITVVRDVTERKLA